MVKEFIIKANSSIDNAEELIRCKDCVWWDKWVSFSKDGRGDCQEIGLSTDGNGYCSMAIRKDGKNEIAYILLPSMFTY